MTNTSKTIVFFGNERLVSGLKEADTPILKGLIQAGYRVAAIVSHHADSQSRTHRPLEVAAVAEAYGIPLFLPRNPADIYDELQALQAEAAVLSAYGRIVPQSIIDLFPKGIINVHPSLLPKHRGPTPIEATILDGDEIAGISIMQLAAKMDAGPVYAQRKITLNGDEDKFNLYTQLAPLGSGLLLETLPQILDGTLTPLPQDEAEATYCQLLSKADARLDSSQLTAPEAERRVRAYLGFPKTKVTYKDHDIIVTKAHVAAMADSPLDSQYKDGRFLVIDELIAPSGRQMTAKAFLNGYAA